MDGDDCGRFGIWERRYGARRHGVLRAQGTSARPGIDSVVGHSLAHKAVDDSINVGTAAGRRPAELVRFAGPPVGPHLITTAVAVGLERGVPSSRWVVSIVEGEFDHIAGIWRNRAAKRICPRVLVCSQEVTRQVAVVVFEHQHDAPRVMQLMTGCGQVIQLRVR